MTSETLRAPVTFVVLALLHEAPMHPYRMGQLIRERGKDRVVNVARRNSVQQAVNRLARDGLIQPQSARREGHYPARVVYSITDAGRELLFRWLEEMLARPADEYPRFPAALAFLAMIGPGEAAELLERRRRALIARREELIRSLENPARLARVLLIEDEYDLAMTRAELAWLDMIAAQLRDGTLSWDTRALIAHEGRESPASATAVDGTEPEPGRGSPG